MITVTITVNAPLEKVWESFNSPEHVTKWCFASDDWQIVPLQKISYTMIDGRKAVVRFEPGPDGIEVIEKFDPEQENAPEMHQEGWQMILNNFKKYVESI